MCSKFRSRPNILLSAYCVDNNDVSEAQMAYEWISRLSEFVNLWVITTGSRLHDKCGLEELPNITLVELKPMLNYKKFDRFDRAVHPGYYEFYLRAKKVAQKILKKERIDLCHHLTPQSVRFPSPFAGCSSPFIIGPLHGGLRSPGVMKEMGGKEGLLFKLRLFDDIRRKCDPGIRKTFKYADKVVISAPYMQDVVSIDNGDKYRLIPGTAVPLLDISSQRNESGSVNFIFVGRIVPSKGIELLVEALAKCKTTKGIVTVYGRGEVEQYCKDLARRLDVNYRIRWMGFVDQEEVYKGYSKADVFILPSLKEPTGGAVLEAMSAGLPVICVDTAGPAYAVDSKSGIKVALGNKETMIAELVQAIEFMVEHPRERQEMGRNARQRVRDHFTWDAVVEKMLSVYEEVIHENKK